MKVWHINYNGWRICHDPMGKLACYKLNGDTLEWCYFGSKLEDIKREIDEREYIANLTD